MFNDWYVFVKPNLRSVANLAIEPSLMVPLATKDNREHGANPWLCPQL
jgi:hypothetical protein